MHDRRVLLDGAWADGFGTSAPRLVVAALSGDLDAAELAYDGLIRGLVDLPPWSPEYLEGRRIPCSAFKVACTHPVLRNVLGSHGLYMFGSDERGPRYWGKAARQPLGKRLGRRYLGGGRRAQYALACETRRLGGFPEGIRVSKVRRKGATDWAEDDPGDLWFTVLPIARLQLVGLAEPLLIYVGERWNLGRDFPELVNEQHTGRPRHSR
jgi:hypothetical protein